MKSKQNLLVVALHVVVLAVFSLLQGCATGECPIDWLNWPYNTPADEPIIVPSEEYSDSLVLPPATYTDDSTISTYSAPAAPMIEPSQTYTVQKGDTLSGIASMYGTSWKKLAEFNSLSNPNKLYVGQEILIPGSLSASTPITRTSSPSTGGSVSTSGSPIRQGTSYVIQKGDTLSGIAKRAGLSVAEIKAANALNNNVIIAGKSLSIPKKGEVSAPVSSFSAPVVEEPVDEAPALAPVAESAPEPAPIADIAPLEPAASAPVYEHVLYPGETLEDVARQYGSSQDEIMMLNGITSPDSVKPGTKLLVPIPE
jgi:LysM repeat protein